MTTVTPEHNSEVCHAATENRRMILNQLKDLANQLEQCEVESKQQMGMQSAACSSPCYYPCGNPECPPCCTPVKSGNQLSNGPNQNNGRRHSGKGDSATSGNMVCIPCPASKNDATSIEERQNQENLAKCQRNSSRPQEDVQGMMANIPSFAGHMFENRYVKPDPSKLPLITYPDYPRIETRPRTPPEKSDLTQKSHSRELLSGTILTGCDCVRRNGLQDQCRRVDCQGSTECRTKPEPQCIPGMIARGAHKEVKAYKEAENKQKELEKHHLQVCCKCPKDCFEKKFEKENEEEEILKRVKKMCEQQTKINENTQGKQRKNHETSEQNETIYCCYPAQRKKVLKGQFEKRLVDMETDPMRGPLMNH